MKRHVISILLINVLLFVSLTIFAGERVNSTAVSVNNSSAETVFLSGASFFEYCTVSLANPRSHLNVRTWEGRVIGKLAHGTTVWVNEYSGDWARVSVKRGRRWVSVGWVDSSYLLC
ncbi:MAG: SH3 domain-containing protein [Acidobacteria bacterium]|nr:SH3 domain-containing protein [Acidobacteriota bacterium]MBK8149919.1 SH3 domain-containing protein [Acidobacteriota bacterium]MBK8809137.1 SH3 domain-containing protein [Acidobacteriota bacterium]